MNVSTERQRWLDKWTPWLLALGAMWLFGRGLRRAFWSLFGMAWALFWLFGHH